MNLEGRPETKEIDIEAKKKAFENAMKKYKKQ